MVGILLNALYVVTCLLLVAVVLMQQGKGGDIAAAFATLHADRPFSAAIGS